MSKARAIIAVADQVRSDGTVMSREAIEGMAAKLVAAGVGHAIFLEHDADGRLLLVVEGDLDPAGSGAIAIVQHGGEIPDHDPIGIVRLDDYSEREN